MGVQKCLLNFPKIYIWKISSSYYYFLILFPVNKWLIVILTNIKKLKQNDEYLCRCSNTCYKKFNFN